VKHIRRAPVGDALVVLPFGSILLLVLGLVEELEQAAKPLAAHF